MKTLGKLRDRTFEKLEIELDVPNYMYFQLMSDEIRKRIKSSPTPRLRKLLAQTCHMRGLYRLKDAFNFNQDETYYSKYPYERSKNLNDELVKAMKLFKEAIEIKEQLKDVGKDLFVNIYDEIVDDFILASDLSTYEKPITDFLGSILKHLFDTMEKRLEATLKEMCELLNQIMGADLNGNGLDGLLNQISTEKNLNYLA